MVKVLHYVAIMNRAGEETFLMNVFRGMDRNKVSFDFLCSLPEPGDYDEEIRSLGGEVLHIELSKSKNKTGVKPIENFVRLYKYLRPVKDKYKIFHIHTQHAMNGFLNALAAKLAGIPLIIVHSHNSNTEYHVKAHKVFRGFLNKMHIIRFACSEEAGRWLFGEKGKFEVIRNGIDVAQYRFQMPLRDKVKRENGWDNQLIIGHVGRFAYQKNHEFIIEIFKEIYKINPKSKLVLVGEGELIPEVKARVKEYGLSQNVAFLGGRDDVNQLMQAFDVFLFPSRYEGFPVVSMEAQTAGLPCVFSNKITKEVVITEKVSFLNLHEDAKIWAEKTLSAAENMDLQDRENDYQKTIDAGYHISKTIQRLTEIYLEG